MTPKPVDERFREDLELQYDALMKVVTGALESVKKVRVERDCKKCGCSHIDYVEVENTDAAMKAVEFLSNRGVGRPGTVEVGEREVVHEYRLEWVKPVEISDAASAAVVATVGGEA